MLSKNWFIYAPKPKLFSFAWSIGIKPRQTIIISNQNTSSADPASLFRFSIVVDFMFLFTNCNFRKQERKTINNWESYLSSQGSDLARWFVRFNKKQRQRSCSYSESNDSNLRSPCIYCFCSFVCQTVKLQEYFQYLGEYNMIKGTTWLRVERDKSMNSELWIITPPRRRRGGV